MKRAHYERQHNAYKLWFTNSFGDVTKKANVIRIKDAKSFMEGNEHCKLYFDNDNLVFGVSNLDPGLKGDVDPGHKDSYEVFFVARGKILCHLPDEDVYEELCEGDAILIPPPRPHALINVGENTATVVWSQARIGEPK